MTLVAGRALADTFLRQAALNAVSPITAAVFGGVAVSLLIRWAQRRRERRQLRNSLSFEMMRTAYSFYFPLIEIIRRERYAALRGTTDRRFFLFGSKTQQRQSVDLGDLAHQYEEFRITARVIEEQLRVNFPDAHVRWLWHGVVDMLSARYYRLVHIPKRFNDMVQKHSEHTTDSKIPEDTRKLFMTLADYRDEKTVDEKLLSRYEIFLNEATQEVLKLKPYRQSGAALPWSDVSRSYP
jgi:hypothetical protein